MDDYFKLPTGYLCLQRNNDLIYAYGSNYQVRDTYELDNFKYVRIASTSSNVPFNVNVCLPQTMTHLIPNSFAPFVFLSMSIFVCLIISGLFYVFKR